MLNKKIDEYLKNDYYPFHMPGSKRTDILRDDLPYQRDLTEIEGFDNLNDPGDILLDLNKKIAEIYGVKNAIISTNGSTCGILATIRALTYENNNILIQRSSHKAIYNAIELNNLNPSYIDVVLSEENAVVDIDYEDFYKKIRSKDFSAVIVTSPSYEGYIIDLEKIYKECQKQKVPLIVDLAHGSHFLLNNMWQNYFDIAITSFHKNLSALTPAACVFINNKKYFSEIQRNMAIFQTSSPSYIIMQSIDDMVNNYCKFNDLYKIMKENLDELYTLKLKHLKLIEHPNKDKSKILISTNNSNINGDMLQSLLKQEKIEIEMSYPSYALLISTIFDKKIGFDRLKEALIKIDKNLDSGENASNFSYFIPETIKSIKDAQLSKKKCININNAKNRISGQFIYAYPPGIPLVVPGEVIDSTIIKTINNMFNNGISLNISTDVLIIDWHFFL